MGEVDGMLKVILSDDIKKLDRQIKALEFQLKEDTAEKDIEVHTVALKKINEVLLYKQYLDLQSKEFKENLIGYEELKMPGKDIAIKVNFTSFWLYVYRTENGQIEWY